MDRSPLELYCESIDVKYPDASYMQLYYNVALKVDRNYFTQLFIRDLVFRANHQRNFIGSVEGLQGCGKSLFSIALALILGNLFGFLFNITVLIFYFYFNFLNWGINSLSLPQMNN